MNKTVVSVIMMLLATMVVCSAEPDYRGFAGYAYESGMNAIAADMEEEGYTLISKTNGALWYSATMLGIDCELGYVFKNDQLVGGAMILASHTDADFALINDHLRTTYNVRVNVEISDGRVVATLRGADSKITQTLDKREGIHEVEYIREE